MSVSTEIIKQKNYLEKKMGVFNRHIIIQIIFPLIGGLLFGYDTGVISGAMLIIKNYFHLDLIYQELIVSMTVLSASISSLLIGIIGHYFGRKLCLILAGIMYTIGSLVLGLANGYPVLIFGRIIIGIGVGCCATICPIYISETVPESVRGRLILLYNGCIMFGQFVASLFNAALFSIGLESWRYMLGIATIPGLILFVGSIFFIPESFRWLIFNGKMSKAIPIISKNLNVSYEEAEEVAEKIYSENMEIKNTMKKQMESLSISQKSTLIRIFQDNIARKSLLIGCTLQALQQLIGINTIMYYIGTLLNMAGTQSIKNALWYSVPIIGASIPPGILGFILIDKIGRRKLSMISLGITVASIFLIAIVFQIMASITNPVTNRMALNSTIPYTTQDKECSFRENCESCISDHKCGFCMTENNRSSCLILNERFAKYTTKGNCSKLEIKNSHSILFTEACPSKYSWIIILGLIFYLWGFQMGMGPIPWTITSEIYPLWCREINMSISTMVNWSMNLIISLTFLSLAQSITKYGTFYLYGSIGFIGLFFIYYCLPETNQKSLEEITLLHDSHSK